MPETTQLVLAARALDACHEAEALLEDTTPRTVDHETVALALVRVQAAYDSLAYGAELTGVALAHARATIEGAKTTLAIIRGRYQRHGATRSASVDRTSHTQPRFARVVTFPSDDPAFRDHVLSIVHREMPEIPEELEATLRASYPLAVVRLRQRLAETADDPDPVWYAFRDGGVLRHRPQDDPPSEPERPHRHGSGDR